MQNQLFTLQIYTPGSDIAAGVRPSQIIGGRTGNDALLGFQPISAQPGQTQIDLFLLDISEDTFARQWSDTVILGDSRQAYYANGNPDIFGVNDFGFLADFNPALDTAQLYGNSNDYQLLDVGVGSALLQQQQTGFDVVGFFLGNSNLNLEANYFQYQGNTPPAPVLPKIDQLGTSGFDLSVTTATDSEGNVYIAGGTNGSLQGTNAGARDAFIAKYDNQGNLLKTIQVGTSDSDTISGIDTDADGNFYVAGITAGNLQGTKQAASTDAFVAKYNSEGELQWIDQFGQNIIFQSFSIDVADTGEVYLSGIDVKDAPAPQFATDDFWTAKYDTDGNQVWFTETGAENFDEAYGTTVSKDGSSVYTTGWTLSDLAAENAGLYDAHVTKYDSSTGDVQWIRQFGTSDYDWSWDVDTDTQGNVYATGWTLGDLAQDNAGSYDAWLFKFDSSGNQVWGRQFGSSGDDEAFDLHINSTDNIFLTGYTNGNLAGTNAGLFDAWVASYNTEGNQNWITQFGTSGIDQAYGITSDNGDLFVTGVTQGSLGDTNTGSFDAWLAKLNAATGKLLNFGSTSQPDNALSALDFLGTNSSQNQDQSTLVSSLSNGQPTDQEMTHYLTNFFQEFLAEIGVGADGSGLEDLVRNPYGTPPSTSVPEPMAGVGLLMVATAAFISKMFRGRLKNSSSSRASI